MLDIFKLNFGSKLVKGMVIKAIVKPNNFFIKLPPKI